MNLRQTTVPGCPLGGAAESRWACWPRASALRGGLALLVGITALGCGPRSDRFGIDGAITLDGVPLDSGSIRFTSKDAPTPMTAGARIEGGAYHVPEEKGLRVGTYVVEISSPDAAAQPVLDRASGMRMAPERIPPEYNVKTEQIIEVVADGDNQFDFAISSGSAK